jgi:predicted SAM-dependent methyltransferase
VIRNLLRSLSGASPDAPPAAPHTLPLSLNQLRQQNPALADYFLWGLNPAPAITTPLYLHLGCGERVLEGFANLDFIPHDERVSMWNMLDLWPDALAGQVDGVFTEDVLEHFFHAEQVYLLCNQNRVLKTGGVARTLMPSLPKLVDYGAAFKANPEEILHQAFGVDTGADALNIGMRFSGHRWLHGPESLARMAAMCGFEVVATPCAESTVAKFNGINLRDESNSLSFASDLVKRHAIVRTLLLPQAIDGATRVEDVAEGIALYVATARRPTIRYSATPALDARLVACLNFRSSNLSSFREHSLKSLVVDDVHRDSPWHFDETLKSRPCMNLVTRNQLRLVIGDATSLSAMVFSPAAQPGEYFTVGCAEAYTLEEAAPPQSAIPGLPRD